MLLDGLQVKGAESRLDNFPYGSPQFFTALKKINPKYDSEMLGPPPQRS